jgi:hypothetical protein
MSKFKEYLEDSMNEAKKYKKGDIIIKHWHGDINLEFEIRKVEKTYVVARMVLDYFDYEDYTDYNIKYEYILPPIATNMKKLPKEKYEYSDWKNEHQNQFIIL